MRLPTPLSSGARVALVAPAGPLRGPVELDHAMESARSMGWDPVPGAHVLERKGYLAGCDQDRLRDLNAALADERIDAVWCVRGGYGAMRLLSHIDYASLSRRPRVIIGYSDVTALHAAIGSRCDLVTYHGPTARGTLSDFSRESLTRATILGQPSCGLAPDARTIRGGRAYGRLVGGNLSLLAALAGTPYAPEYDGAILMLEDVGEPAYRLDRMLVQLALSGALSRLAGIVAGQFTEVAPVHELDDRTIDDLIGEAADIAKVPAIAGVPLGHIADQWTIPLGATAELDADARSLTVVLS